MSSAVLLFAARVLLLLLLYLFLYLVVRVLRQDLRRATRQPAAIAAPGTPAPPLGLELLDAGQAPLPPGERFALRDPFVIGRSKANDIALDDDWVSAQHVRLRRYNGSWLAEDLGSTNGTRVNGRPLTGAAPLQAGDVLDLGRVKFKVVERP